jgi:serine/threonine-protein kinase
MDEVARALEEDGAGEALPGASKHAQPVGALPSETAMSRYTTQEVRDVLARAIERQEAKRADTRLGFNELLAAAQEVGVDPEVLRQASRELRRQSAPTASAPVVAPDRDVVPESDPEPSSEDLANTPRLWLRRKRRQFFRHLGMYIIINAAMLLLGILLGNYHWVIYPALGWGIGLAADALTTFTATEEDFRVFREHRERKQRRRQRRRKLHDAVRDFHHQVLGSETRRLDVVAEEGARVLLETAAALRQRIATPPGDKLRVASEVASEADALADAASETEARREGPVQRAK